MWWFNQKIQKDHLKNTEIWLKNDERIKDLIRQTDTLVSLYLFKVYLEVVSEIVSKKPPCIPLLTHISSQDMVDFENPWWLLKEVHWISTEYLADSFTGLPLDTPLDTPLDYWSSSHWKLHWNSTGLLLAEKMLNWSPMCSSGQNFGQNSSHSSQFPLNFHWISSGFPVDTWGSVKSSVTRG